MVASLAGLTVGDAHQRPVTEESIGIMLRLRTFGGITLARDEEVPMTGAATQRRRLAILALLAVSGDRGLSRDKLVGYLWADSDTERARHNLNQLLHAERRQFDAPNLFAGVKTLRLDPTLIWTDVGAFERALDTRNLAAAVELYRGPFLDGFFVPGAPEFERWVQSQRDRYAERCRQTIVQLARGASEAGDRGVAIDWWRRGFDQDPLDSGVALGLVKALAEAGDTPGALRTARRHEDALRDELDLPPDAEMLAVVERLLTGGPPPR
jgi:serine/threonine-protein kinase